MSAMGDFVIECGEEYQRRHPEASWEKAMEVITSNNEESEEINDYILKKRKGEPNDSSVNSDYSSACGGDYILSGSGCEVQGGISLLHGCC